MAAEEYRDRADVEVAVLDALVARGQEGVTVLELRTRVDAEIDAIETALEALDEDGLIRAERTNGRLVLRPAERVIPATPSEEPADDSLVDRVRKRLPF